MINTLLAVGLGKFQQLNFTCLHAISYKSFGCRVNQLWLCNGWSLRVASWVYWGLTYRSLLSGSSRHRYKKLTPFTKCKIPVIKASVGSLSRPFVKSFKNNADGLLDQLLRVQWKMRNESKRYKSNWKGLKSYRPFFTGSLELTNDQLPTSVAS
mgnify:CR=1 FL=1